MARPNLTIYIAEAVTERGAVFGSLEHSVTRKCMLDRKSEKSIFYMRYLPHAKKEIRGLG